MIGSGKKPQLAVLGVLLLSACDGTLDPLEAIPNTSVVRAAPRGLHFVEPFDYHYPDEPFFDSIANALELSAAHGQTDASAFVYVPAVSGELRLSAADLTSPDGRIFPAAQLKLAVVTFADRTRARGGRDSADRLTMAFASGARRGGVGADFRGFHQDAREHLPSVPLVITPDALELGERMSTADGFVSLTDVDFARAWGAAGKGVEFWVTANVPQDFAGAEPVTTFTGALQLSTPTGAVDVAITLKVLGFQLDTLEEHGRFAGVTDALSHNPPEFREAIVRDLREHGVNLLRDNFASLTDYAELQAAGFGVLVNTSPDFSLTEIPAIVGLGMRPLFNVGLFEPTADELNTTLQGALALRAAGAELESEMTLDVARRAGEQLPFDAWTYALTTYELSDLHAGEFDQFLALLDTVRAAPERKEVAFSGHYAEVFNGHVPHQARLLYGLWLAQSNLDFGMAYGYAMVDGQNPFQTPSYNGVAFPAMLSAGAGLPPRRVMLPSLTWEAFRAGIDDFRYALTARRVASTNPALQAKLATLLAPYGSLYDDVGDRVDYRNREADVRRVRAQLAALILEGL